MTSPVPSPARPGAPSPARRLALAVAGVILIAIGIVGWLIPVIPGFPALFAGAALLAAASPRVRRALARLREWIRPGAPPPSAAPGAGPRTSG